MTVGVYCYPTQVRPWLPQEFICPKTSRTVKTYKIGCAENVEERIYSELNETLCETRDYYTPEHFKIMRVNDGFAYAAETVLRNRQRDIANRFNNVVSLSISDDNSRGEKEIYFLTENDLEEIWQPIPEYNSVSVTLANLPGRVPEVLRELQEIAENRDRFIDCTIIRGTCYNRSRGQQRERVDSIINSDMTLESLLRWTTRNHLPAISWDAPQEIGLHHHTKRDQQVIEKKYYMADLKWDLERNYIAFSQPN